MKKLSYISIFFIFILVMPFFAVDKTSAVSKMASISTVDANVLIKKNGKTDFKIKINSMYLDILDWDLGIKSIDKITVRADGKLLTSKNYSLVKINNFYKIKSSPRNTASVWEIRFQSDDMFFVTDKENFKWYAISPNHPYINQLCIILESELPIPGNDRKSYRLYAYHGVEFSDAKMINSKKIIYSGNMLSNASGYSIFTSYPRGTIKFPLLKKIIYNITDLPVVNWIIFGVILPLICIILLIILSIRHKTQTLMNSTREMIEHPPNDLSPLQVGILVHKKIYAKTLMATIIDLCEKGYLIIIQKDGKFVFAKRRLPDNSLRSWEKILVEELTLNDSVFSREIEVRRNINKNLFSPKIKASFEEAYLGITDMGFYDQNPHFVRVKYKIYAIFLYLTSIVGLVWVAVTLQPPYMLIPLLGVLFSTMVVIKFAHLLPMQSKKGLIARKEWIKFLNYLKQKETISMVMAISGIFYRYLPYAIVLGVEKQWARRFQKTILTQPGWLIQHEISDQVAEDNLHLLIDVISELTERIAQLKGPSIK